MIIDSHAHVSPPAELFALKASMMASWGAFGGHTLTVSDDQIRAAVEKDEMGPGDHLAMMRKNGVDQQLISPRPFQMMHSFKPARVVRWYHEETNNVIYRQTQLYPDLFHGVCGLPQVAGEPIEVALPELERCVTELDFKGCLLNPDPFENTATPPGLGEPYWYPLYEKLCELDVPAHIHSAASFSEREPPSLHFVNEESIAVYNLVMSTVLDDFPTLKIVVSHGGGAIPYQLGRFEAATLRSQVRFSERVRRLYFDTVLYTRPALEFLIKTVGADRCLFGEECPGVGSVVDPETGRTLDDIRPHIESMDFLSAADKQLIFEDTARAVFKLPAPAASRRASR